MMPPPPLITLGLVRCSEAVSMLTPWPDSRKLWMNGAFMDFACADSLF